MFNFNTKLVYALVSGQPIQEIFKEALENALNLLLEQERTIFLNYDKWSVEGYNTGNSRNGYYDRTLKTEYGELNLKIPRDRLGLLETKTVKAFQESHSNLENRIILLYKKGITTREISEIIERMYGHHYSAATISNLSGALEAEIRSFHQRDISPEYVALFCDATFIPVRRDTVSKEAVHIITGIKPDGTKEIIDFQIFPTEAAIHYREMLQNLKTRGLKTVLLFVSDALTGLADALTNEFPMAMHQTCWTHLLRNTSSKIRVSDKKEVMEELKVIPKSPSIHSATQQIEAFINKWEKKYPKMVEQFKSNINLFSFMHFPKETWMALYTNNLSESINKQIKKKTKVKEQFSTELALEKTVYSYVTHYNMNVGTRVANGFGKTQHEIRSLFNQKCRVNEAKLRIETELVNR